MTLQAAHNGAYIMIYIFKSSYSYFVPYIIVSLVFS